MEDRPEAAGTGGGRTKWRPWGVGESGWFPETCGEGSDWQQLQSSRGRQVGARKGKSRLEGTGRPHIPQQLGLSPAAVGDDSDETIRWDRAKAGG